MSLPLDSDIAGLETADRSWVLFAGDLLFVNQIAEIWIQEAIKRGELRDLLGAGRPL